MDESLASVYGAESERLIVEISKCIMRRLLKEEQKHSKGQDIIERDIITLNPFDRDNHEKLLEIINQFGPKVPGEEKPFEADELINAAIAVLSALRLIYPSESGGHRTMRYSFSDRGRTITHFWFKANGHGPFDEQPANINLAREK